VIRKPALPVDSILPEVLAILQHTTNLVIEAPPGAGKTTRVPPAVLASGEVIVLEPRRIAARLAARRVAWERGEEVGDRKNLDFYHDLIDPAYRDPVCTKDLFVLPKVSYRTAAIDYGHFVANGRHFQISLNSPRGGLCAINREE
jgi:hypothetical protein